MDWNQLVDRMIRAAKLDSALYEEVEADRDALGQSALVVVASSLAVGIASLAAGGAMGLIGGTFMALVSWAVWAGVIWVIGTKLMPEPGTRSDFQELLRVIGFSSAPGVLRIFGFIPILGWLLNFAIALWMAAAMVVAVRQALDYTSTGRAVVVCLLGWLVYLLAFALLSTVFAIGLFL